MPAAKPPRERRSANIRRLTTEREPFLTGHLGTFSFVSALTATREQDRAACSGQGTAESRHAATRGSWRTRLTGRAEGAVRRVKLSEAVAVQDQETRYSSRTVSQTPRCRARSAVARRARGPSPNAAPGRRAGPGPRCRAPNPLSDDSRAPPGLRSSALACPRVAARAVLLRARWRMASRRTSTEVAFTYGVRVGIATKEILQLGRPRPVLDDCVFPYDVYS